MVFFSMNSAPFELIIMNFGTWHYCILLILIGRKELEEDYMDLWTIKYPVLGRDISGFKKIWLIAFIAISKKKVMNYYIPGT